MKSDSLSFGEKLQEIRREKGLTQHDLAEKLNTSQRMIAHYEKKGNRPRIDKVKTLAEALNIKIEDLTGDSTSEKKTKHEETTFNIMKRVKVIEKLPLRDQKAIFRLINSLAQKHGIK